MFEMIKEFKPIHYDSESATWVGELPNFGEPFKALILMADNTVRFSLVTPIHKKLIVFASTEMTCFGYSKQVYDNESVIGWIPISDIVNNDLIYELTKQVESLSQSNEPTQSVIWHDISVEKPPVKVGELKEFLVTLVGQNERVVAMQVFGHNGRTINPVIDYDIVAWAELPKPFLD